MTGKDSDAVRAKVPYALSHAVCRACERDLGAVAEVPGQGRMF